MLCFGFGCLSRDNYLAAAAGDIFGYYPAPTSLKNNAHWAQFVGPLTKYDYLTAAENEAHYGAAAPPEYVVELACFVFYRPLNANAASPSGQPV